MQSDSVSPDNPKTDVNIFANISKTTKPIDIITNV